MIYTRWGIEFQIESAALDVEVDHLPAPVTLVRNKDGRFQFAEFLRADGGLNEVMEAVRAAEPLNISNQELEEAIKQAS